MPLSVAPEPVLRGDVMPSPVPYDYDELASGRSFMYEWEHWVDKIQHQVDSLIANGGSGGGGGASYVHTQSTATSQWTINHYLNTKPGVTVVDNSGQELLAELHYPNNSTVLVTHGSPYSGVAYLRA